MTNITITIAEKTSAPSGEFQNLRKVAIVKHKPRDLTSWGGGLVYAPDGITMQDKPSGESKGPTIPIFPPWWEYIRKINNDAGYGFARSVSRMWINKQYMDADGNVVQTPHAERIHCGGCFVTWDEETTTHVRLIPAGLYRENPNSRLDPAVDNWFMKPHLYWKPCAIDKNGTIYVIGVSPGIDAYIPLIGHDGGLWMRKDRLEFFPTLPYGEFYELRGLDVYKQRDGVLSPLMTTAPNRVRTWYTDWRITTLGTVPAVV